MPSSPGNGSTSGAASSADVRSAKVSDAAARAKLSGLRYVALGDSFTADWGVDPVASDAPSAGCRQSSNDYPHQVAANLGLALHDVSCSGATTKEMTSPQTVFPDTSKTYPAALPQFQALGPTTDIVTVGIGGNDFGFAEIAAACAVDPVTGYVFGDATWPSSAYFTACRDYYDPGGTPGADTLRQRIAAVVGPVVRQTVAGIRQRAPQAKVFYVDYLSIAPQQADSPNPATYPQSCYLSLLNSQAFPFGAVDTPYLAGLQNLLNDTVDAAATAAGATVISPYAQSRTHTPCAGTADPWINGITVSVFQQNAAEEPASRHAPTGITVSKPARPPVPGRPRSRPLVGATVAVGSLHPNLEGAVRQAEAVTRSLLDAFTPTGPGPGPTTRTTPSLTTASPTRRPAPTPTTLRAPATSPTTTSRTATSPTATSRTATSRTTTSTTTVTSTQGPARNIPDATWTTPGPLAPADPGPDLAATGAPHQGALPVTATLLIAAGVALTLLGRRRKKPSDGRRVS